MSKCKGCGKEIIWATNVANGKKIQLDPKPPTYDIVEAAVTPTESEVYCARITAMVSHFTTRPNANDFSASKRREKS